MRKMSGALGLALLVLLLSSGASEALFPAGKPATTGEAAKEYAKEAVRDSTDAAKNVGEAHVASVIKHLNQKFRNCACLSLMVACFYR